MKLRTYSLLIVCNFSGVCILGIVVVVVPNWSRDWLSS